MISVAADLVGMHPQTLRMYEAKGLVRPGRHAGRHAALLGRRRRAAAPHPASDDGARAEPRRCRARAAAAGRAQQGAGAHGCGSSASCGPRSPRFTARTSAKSCSTGRRSTRPRGDDMDFQKLTLKSQEAVAAAQELARRAGNPELTPDHLTVGAPRPGAAAHARRPRRAMAPATLRAEAEARLRQLPTVTGGEPAAGLGASQPRARRRVRRDAQARRRVRLGRAPPARPRRRSRATRCSRRSKACAAGRRSRRRTPRARTRRSRSTAAI